VPPHGLQKLKVAPYQFLRVTYTAISASQHSNHINGCVPMCDNMCPRLRDDKEGKLVQYLLNPFRKLKQQILYNPAWATPTLSDVYYQLLTESRSTGL